MVDDKRSVLVVCAHSDDHIFGPGGTIIKYAREGCEVNTIIFTFGDKSHPHYKPEVIRNIRVREAERVNKFIGGKNFVFLGLHEGCFLKEYMSKSSVQSRLEHFLLKFNPDIIFTHSKDEFHKDHREVHNILKRAIRSAGIKPEVYSFDVWNVINFKDGVRVKLVVDISHTFRDKIKALMMFKSQKLQALIPLLWSVYVKAFITGFRYNMRFAEVFYRVK